MKHASLSFPQKFPQTPISGYAGARMFGWVNRKSASGQPMRPVTKKHPFQNQRPLWCLLEIHFDGVELRFATPRELDQFLDVMSKNPLPSGRSLVSWHRVGRPHNHWLAKLPKRAKTWKYRKAVCSYLEKLPEAAEFRRFYESSPIKYEFDGFHDDFVSATKG